MLASVLRMTDFGGLQRASDSVHNTLLLLKINICYLFAYYSDKNENQIFLKYKEIQSGALAKSYMRKGFLIYEEMRKEFPIFKEAVSHL